MFGINFHNIGKTTKLENQTEIAYEALPSNITINYHNYYNSGLGQGNAINDLAVVAAGIKEEYPSGEQLKISDADYQRYAYLDNALDRAEEAYAEV